MNKFNYLDIFKDILTKLNIKNIEFSINEQHKLILFGKKGIVVCILIKDSNLDISTRKEKLKYGLKIPITNIDNNLISLLKDFYYGNFDNFTTFNGLINIKGEK